MKKYKIPRTDLEVSRIAYGCMKLGGCWDDSPYTESDISFARKAVLTALDQGINFFDHADIYSKGKSEEVFAEIMKESPGKRENIILQSKCGNRFEGEPEPGDPGRYDFRYDYIIESVEGILKRLNTDYLDILLLHRPDPLVEPEEVARAFDRLHQSGKVRHFGVSNHNASQIALLQKDLNQPLVANQVELNLLHSHMIYEGIIWNIKDDPIPPAGGTLEYCRINDIMIQAWGPVSSGKLINPEKNASLQVKETVRLIDKYAQEKNVSREAIAIGWLLRHPAKILPIIGTINTDRIKASCLADTVALSREEWYSLFSAARGKPMP